VPGYIQPVRDVAHGDNIVGQNTRPIKAGVHFVVYTTPIIPSAPFCRGRLLPYGERFRNWMATNPEQQPPRIGGGVIKFLPPSKMLNIRHRPWKYRDISLLFFVKLC